VVVQLDEDSLELSEECAADLKHVKDKASVEAFKTKYGRSQEATYLSMTIPESNFSQRCLLRISCRTWRAASLLRKLKGAGEWICGREVQGHESCRECVILFTIRAGSCQCQLWKFQRKQEREYLELS